MAIYVFEIDANKKPYSRIKNDLFLHLYETNDEIFKVDEDVQQYKAHIQFVPKLAYSWPPKPSKYFSVGIFEYILASMLNVFLDV